MSVHRLNHRPPQPPGPLLRDAAVPGDSSAAVGGRDDPRIAAELIPGPEPVDVTHLGLHQNSRVVADTGDGGEQSYLLVAGRDVPELEGEYPDLLLQGRHEPEVAVDGFMTQAAEPFGAFLGEQTVSLGRLDPLVGEGAPDLHLELGLLPDYERPSSHLLPEHRDVWRGHVAQGEAVQPEQLRKGHGVNLVRLDAGLRDVPGLLRVGDEDVVSLLGELPVEGCDAACGLHGHPFHPVGFEEVGDLLVRHFSLGQFFSVWPQDGRVGVFLVDVQSRTNSAHRMA